VYTTYKGFGSIRKKPEIYTLPLKRKPAPGDRNMEAVMKRMPDKLTWTRRLMRTERKNVH
jgi:hypothetical protein